MRFPPAETLEDEQYRTANRWGFIVRFMVRQSSNARRRRHARFFPLTAVRPEHRVVDIGCGGYGLRLLEPQLDVTGVDLDDWPEYPGRFVQADASEGLPFEDGEFDLAYSNSVIEHVPPERREAFAREVRRVARGWFIQTPALPFPIDAHSLLPLSHWLPAGARRQYWKLGAGGQFEDVRLLRRRDMAALFGEPVAERVGGFPKSWISIRPVEAATARGEAA